MAKELSTKITGDSTPKDSAKAKERLTTGLELSLFLLNAGLNKSVEERDGNA